MCFYNGIHRVAFYPQHCLHCRNTQNITTWTSHPRDREIPSTHLTTPHPTLSSSTRWCCSLEIAWFIDQQVQYPRSFHRSRICPHAILRRFIINSKLPIRPISYSLLYTPSPRASLQLTFVAPFFFKYSVRDLHICFSLETKRQLCQGLADSAGVIS